MRKSKYIDKRFDHGWVCTHVGVARTQPKFYKGTRIECKRPHHQSYYYIFERVTSDSKAEKLIRLDRSEAAKVWRKEIEVEAIVKARQARSERKFTQKVSYHFIDKEN